jgi:hypothetical protein
MFKGAEALEADALRILYEYSKLQADFPGCIMDTSWLPASKQRIKEALKLLWQCAENQEGRDWAEIGFSLLGWFQDGVGQTPITVKKPSHIPITLTENEWLIVALTENEALAVEFDHFKENRRRAR